MAWSKTGDNAATHPLVMNAIALGPQPVDRLEPQESACLLYGMLQRCASESAGHETDYFVSDGTVITIIGANYVRWSRLAAKAGFWSRAKGRKGWDMVRDPEFIHIRLKAEIAWDRQRQADVANPSLTIPVRVRDGDSCRYCGLVVSFGAKRGGKRGTYDHRQPGQPGTVDTMVVACGMCNASRGDDPEADERIPLRPAPLNPYYSDSTIDLLKRNGIDVTVRPGTPPDTAPATSPRPRHRASRDLAVDETPRPDIPKPVSADPAKTGSMARVGSGRVGSGTPQASRKRGRRGRAPVTNLNHGKAPP